MKWFISSLFLVTLYFFGISIYLLADGTLVIVSMLALIFLSVVNFIFSIFYVTTSNDLYKVSNEMRKVMLFVKLMVIPFFVSNFLILALGTVIIALFPKTTVLTFFSTPILVFLTFLILLATSLFSIPAIILYGRTKELNKVEVVIHVILQLIFVFDIIDAIFLFFYLRKRKTPNNLNV
ncbi:UNVERIFIED_CONTAM: hypothetical protein Cloal_3287 [Acetivibrio alkalicellulosi]